MMEILDKIAADKRREVRLKESVIPLAQLEKSVLFQRRPLSLVSMLKHKNTGIIAEHKRRSPSRSVINQNHSVEDVVNGYATAGACGISVLTDGKYFGGSLDDLLLARASVQIPLLRKEFIINEYQVVEAKAYGADVILLIAALLGRNEIRKLSELAKSFGMEVLLEVHDEEELHKSLMPSLDLLGVNNRNLKTFEVSLQASKDLAHLIPEGFIKVSESGISSAAAIAELKTYGFRGFLIGEYFMKSENPGSLAANLIKQLQL
jgi:indole-3-glycerol phosphate synthase